MAQRTQPSRQQSQDDEASALREFLGTDRLINTTRYNLGAYKEVVEKDGKKRQVLKKRDDALMNLEGIQNVMALMRSIVDPNQILSNYDETHIRRIMQDLHMELVEELALNWERYGIQNQADANKVTQIVTDNCYSVLRRAKGGKSLDTIAETTKTQSKKVIDPRGDDRGGGLRSKLRKL